MRITAYGLKQRVAGTLVMLLAVPLAAKGQQELPSQQDGAPSVQQAQPLTPQGATNSAVGDSAPALPNDPASVGSKTSNAGQALSGAPATAEPLGIAASRPAGAAIAPAKQRRTRSILIKVGLIVGAAVAIGTVVALSESSPSRPN